MKNSSKWLTGFGIAIGIFVIVAVVLVMATPDADQIDLPAADTPEGVVMRYFEALRQEEYETAYSYLDETLLAEREYTFEMWRSFWGSQETERMWKVSVTGSSETTEKATIDIELSVFRPDASISSAIQTNEKVYSLVKTGNGWKITEPLEIPWEIRY